MSLKKAIINILKTNNMTVAFVAQESGLDVAQVNETLKRPVATWSIQILNALADALGECPGELLERIQDFDFHLHTDDDQLTIQHVQFQTPSSYQQVRFADALGECPGELLERIQDFDFHLHTDDDQLTIQHVQFQTPSSYQQVRFAVESNVLEGWEPTATEVRQLKESAENPDDEILMEIEQLFGDEDD